MASRASVLMREGRLLHDIPVCGSGKMKSALRMRCRRPICQEYITLKRDFPMYNFYSIQRGGRLPNFLKNSEVMKIRRRQGKRKEESSPGKVSARALFSRIVE
jgi:hypothetical protein